MSRVRNTTPSGAGTAKADAYQIITDRIVTKMESGAIPWHKPWHTYGTPRNYVTGHVYTGINALLLHFLSDGLPFFLTYKQAKQLGGYIRAGAKGFPVIYYALIEKEKENGEIEERPFVNYSTLFNVADLTGVDVRLPAAAAREHEPLAAAEAIVSSWVDRPHITHMDQQAYYVPGTDYVNMPAFGSFVSAELYYKVLFHELTHATGHRRRLNRADLMDKDNQGAAGYAREELTAEIGAAFLCGAAGISPAATDDNAAAYLQFWLSKLKADKTLLIKAASHAKKAANLILGVPANSETAPGMSPQAGEEVMFLRAA